MRITDTGFAIIATRVFGTRAENRFILARATESRSAPVHVPNPEGPCP